MDASLTSPGSEKLDVLLSQLQNGEGRHDAAGVTQRDNSSLPANELEVIVECIWGRHVVWISCILA